MKSFHLTNNSISVATIIMMASVFLSRVIGLFREMVIAALGGTSVNVDAYVTSFILPEILNHFMAGGFLSITFIPLFQRYLIDNREEEGWKSFSNLLTLGSLLFIIILPIVMFISPSIVKLLGKNIREPATFKLTVKLTRIILPAQLFFYWGAFLNAVQMAKKRFFLPALAPLCYNAGIILGGIFLGPTLGIEGFAWGVLIGAFLGNFLIQLPGAIGCGMRFYPIFNFRHPDVSYYIKKTLPLVLGVSMTFSNELFFRFFGSFLKEGATSSINYSLRTMMMIVAISGQASGVASYPFLSKLATEKKFDEMNNLISTVIKKIAIYLIPLLSILFLLSEPIISILYQRGKFNEVSVQTTAGLFKIYLLGSFAFSSAIIIARAFYATENMLLPMIISTSVSILSIPLYLIFSYFLEANGIAIAAIITMFLQYFILFYLWNKRYSSMEKAFKELLDLIKITIVTILGTAPAALLMYLTKTFIHINNIYLKNIILIIIIFFPAQIFIYFLFDLTRIQSLDKTLKEIIGKG